MPQILKSELNVLYKKKRPNDCEEHSEGRKQREINNGKPPSTSSSPDAIAVTRVKSSAA